MKIRTLIQSWYGVCRGCIVLVVISLMFLSPVSSQPTTFKQSDTAEEGGATLLSLRLVPQNVTLWGAKATQRFLVLGEFTDGLERDVSSQSHFSISDSEKAKVDAAGRVMALADGVAVLTATFRDRLANTNIRVESSQEKRPFSFSRDIGGIFTRQGCNDSNCHGGVKGQAGFKLSLNASYPKADYKWIVEGGTYQVMTAESGPKNPRINLKEPEQSLLLLKPTMSIPHGGGKRFDLNSEDYAAILQWIRSGAAYGEDSEGGIARVQRLEALPSEAAIVPKGTHQLLVTAILSNGRREDITHQVRFNSNNPEIVKVTSEGRVEAVRTGETAVMIRTAGHAVSATFAVIAQPISNYPKVSRRNFIDEQVFAKLRKFNIVPSELSSDTEFLRRVCLDLTGTLPPPQRVREFVASKDPQKRDKLIEILLNSPEYVDYWTFRFADLFRVGVIANAYSSKDSQAYWEWIRASLAENQPYDQTARERIAAVGNSAPSRHFMPNTDPRQPENKMAEQVRVFMGRRLDCAQCHNHPYEAWSQDQFWGMAAFFGRMNQLGVGGALYDDPTGQETEEMETDGVLETRKVIHPRTKEEVQPTFLDGQVLPEMGRSDLRMKLAEWMTSHPYFSEAAVNRMWSYFFGRGIVDPVDDFRSTNPPTHPDLLKSLAEDFKDHGYNLKHLFRQIVHSRTYQLSSKSNETNKDDGIDYSHALPRPLDAEVLLDAICQVTGVPEIFEHLSGRIALAGRLPVGTRAINVKEPDIYPSQFLDLYGRQDRQRVIQRDTRADLKQALHQLAGPVYTDKLTQKGGRVERLLKSGATNQEIIEELYLVALSRFPVAKEYAELEKLLGQETSRRKGIQNLLWAVLNSREFSTNH